MPAAIQREAFKIREILEDNFRACNEEDIDALMATFSPTIPGLARFQREALKMFSETDVYLRLHRFQLIGYRPPYAIVRVVQVTLPADAYDDEGSSVAANAYRGSTALLPEWEKAVYTQQFKKEGGRWRLHAILERPAEWLGD